MSSSEEYTAWINDPSKAGTLPYGIFEPSVRRKGVGAAVVVRAAIYFKLGYTTAVREALAAILAEYETAIGSDNLKWYLTEGKAPLAKEKAPSFRQKVTSASADEPLTVFFTGGLLKYEASFYQFGIMTLAKWAADLGTRGLDALYFTVPTSFLQVQPRIFEKLFTKAVAALPTVTAHAGFAVNLSPLDSGENESAEYFLAENSGPGVDIGDPMSTSVIDLTDKVKTADWLVALGPEVFANLGKSIGSLGLPPTWFKVSEVGAGGLILQSGRYPQMRGDTPIQGTNQFPPAAYVLCYHAIKKVVASEADLLQVGLPGGEMPSLNSKVATKAWLTRFEVPDAQLNPFWLELHKTPPV